jgi:hypothetical protein
VSGAGCPRVTHPFAALPSEGLPLLRFPLDLHVLGTPPAFVLSQDQTLRREPLDPAPSACLGPGSGSLLESRPHRAAHPDRPSCDAFHTTVEPADTANRASRDQRGKRTGFWHTVQFSRCERRPEGRDSKRWGRATPHGRHVRVRRQPRSSRGRGSLSPGTTIAGIRMSTTWRGRRAPV